MPRNVVGQPRDDRDAGPQAGARRDAALTPPITSEGSRMGPNRSLPTPAAARSGAYSPVVEVVEAALERPVALADAGIRKAAAEPVVRPATRRVRSHTSGSCRCSQRSLGPTDCWVTPHRAFSTRAFQLAASSSISACARPSL